LLRTRRFGTFCFASLLSNIGTWAQQVGEPWLLLSLGASSFLIGLDAFAISAPVWILTLVGGILADRSDRRRIIATFQSIQMLCPTLLVVLLLIGIVQPWIVIVLSLVVGITDALSMPSFQSIVPSIVKHEQIASALALNSSQFNLSRILGPAFAGVLMAGMGAVGYFALSAASYLPLIWVAIWILPHRAAGPRAGEKIDRRDLVAGIRDIARQPRIRGALVTVLVTSTLCGPLIIFCPVLVKDVLHGDAREFSVAIGAFGVGGLLGAIGLLGIDADRDRRRLSSWSAASYGLMTALAGLNPWFWGITCSPGTRRLLDEREQYLGEFPVAGHGVAGPPRARGKPLHAGLAGRHLDRQPAHRDFRKFPRHARRPADQWYPRGNGASRHRTAMDALKRADARFLTRIVFLQQYERQRDRHSRRAG